MIHICASLHHSDTHQQATLLHDSPCVPHIAGHSALPLKDPTIPNNQGCARWSYMQKKWSVKKMVSGETFNVSCSFAAKHNKYSVYLVHPM